MSGRTPSFIVVGLVIIMFILGLFYMSCSSKNTEFRLSLEQFEERIRSLTIKHSDAEKNIDNLNSRKRELEDEKSNIQRQMEKKDSEINDLNTKLNEKIAELRSLKSDKVVVDEQLKEYKSLSETIAAKNSLIEKLQQQLNEQKQTKDDEFRRLKQEYDLLKTNLSTTTSSLPLNNEQQNTFQIPNQRFRPLLENSSTTKSIPSLFQGQFNQLNNLTKEIKAHAVPETAGILNQFQTNSNSSRPSVMNEQQQINNIGNDQQMGRQFPQPPLANVERQQSGRIESAQIAAQPAERLRVDNSQFQHRNEQNLNNRFFDNQNPRLADVKNNEEENDDEDQLDDENEQMRNRIPPIPSRQENLDNIHRPIQPPLHERSNDDNYRQEARRRHRKLRLKKNQGNNVELGQNVEKRNNL